MTTLHVATERRIPAEPATVYAYLAGLSEHRPHYLPTAVSGYEVESGGSGAGTVFRYVLTAGGRNRSYRMVVAEPDPGRVLTESDSGSSLVTTYTVSPAAGDASATSVRVETSWQGAGGVGGFFERMFAPKVLERVHAEALERLAGYAARQGGVAAQG